MTATASSDLRFDAGRVSLDLIATISVSERLSDGPVERLNTPQRLVAWLYGTGLVPRGTRIPADAGWLDHFHGLRDVLHEVVDAELRGEAVALRDIEALNGIALAPPPAPSAVRAHDGTLTLALAAEPDCAGLLAAVARDALDLLTDADARRQLRQCEGESCTLVYLDTSRGRRRRWCSSEVCGNRERVARHRRRVVASR